MCPSCTSADSYLWNPVCVMALQSPASLCEPHSCSGVCPACACQVSGARDKAPTLDPRLLLCTGLVTLRESCREGFANSWALLNSIPAEYMCPWLVPKQNSPSLGDPTDKPSGEPPPCPDPTLRTPYTELSISHVPRSSCAPLPSLHREVPLSRIRRVG